MTHPDQDCSCDRTQQETGSRCSAFQRQSLSDLTRLWLSPKESSSGATHPATAFPSKAGSSRREGSRIPAMGWNMPCMHFLGQPCLFTPELSQPDLQAALTLTQSSLSSLQTGKPGQKGCRIRDIFRRNPTVAPSVQAHLLSNSSVQ